MGASVQNFDTPFSERMPSGKLKLRKRNWMESIEGGKATKNIKDLLTELLEGDFYDFLCARGIHVKDAETFYRMLTSAKSMSIHDEVDIECFVGGCLQMKGNALSIDLHAVEFKVSRMLRRQNERLKRIERLCLWQQD